MPFKEPRESTLTKSLSRPSSSSGTIKIGIKELGFLSVLEKMLGNVAQFYDTTSLKTTILT